MLYMIWASNVSPLRDRRNRHPRQLKEGGGTSPPRGRPPGPRIPDGMANISCNRRDLEHVHCTRHTGRNDKRLRDSPPHDRWSPTRRPSPERRHVCRALQTTPGRILQFCPPVRVGQTEWIGGACRWASESRVGERPPSPGRRREDLREMDGVMRRPDRERPRSPGSGGIGAPMWDGAPPPPLGVHYTAAPAPGLGPPGHRCGICVFRETGLAPAAAAPAAKRFAHGARLPAGRSRVFDAHGVYLQRSGTRRFAAAARRAYRILP